MRGWWIKTKPTLHRALFLSSCAAITVVGTVFGIARFQTSSPLARPKIDADALNAVDYDSDDREILDFVRLANDGEVIGRPASEFNALLVSAFRTEIVGSVRRLEFLLPTTDAKKQSISRYGGQVPCWPMMLVDVDEITGKIKFVVIYAQCL